MSNAHVKDRSQMQIWRNRIKLDDKRRVERKEWANQLCFLLNIDVFTLNRNTQNTVWKSVAINTKKRAEQESEFVLSILFCCSFCPMNQRTVKASLLKKMILFHFWQIEKKKSTRLYPLDRTKLIKDLSYLALSKKVTITNLISNPRTEWGWSHWNEPLFFFSG